MVIMVNPGRLVLVLWMVTAVTCMSLPEKENLQDSSSTGVSRFKIKVKESGKTFVEEVEVNTEDQTETFSVPQHNQVDQSSIKHLFDLNLTVYRFNLRGVCFVTVLKSDQPPPKKLAEDMTLSNGIRGNNEEIKSSTFLIIGRAENDQYRTPRIQDFCRGLVIYNVEPFVDDWMIENEEDDSSMKTTRKRRQSNSPGGLTCPKNTNFPPDCPLDKIQRRCLIQGQTCTYFRNCGVIEKEDGSGFVTDCRTRHLLDDFICCTNNCLES